MKWNNGKAHKALNKEHERLLELGMTEEQAQAMYDYDLSVLNGNRREAIHNQRLDLQAFDEEDTDDGQNPLLEKFADKLTVEIDRSAVNRYSWVDEIEDEGVVLVIKSLSLQDVELLTKMVVDKSTLTEIAQMENITQQAVSKRLKKIKNIFQNRL